MNRKPTRKAKQGETQADGWPREVKPGRAVVRVYRRLTPSGNFAFMVANYADGERRRFDSYKTEEEALSAADTLAKRLDKRDYVAASMTKDQAIEYANSDARLKPFGVTVDAATAAVAECLKVVHDLARLHEAVRFWAARHKVTTARPVPEAVAEFLKLKKGRGASDRYMADLEGRLERFAADCNSDCCNVTTADVQAWLDALKSGDGSKLSAQSYRNNRTVLHTFFGHCVSRGYAADNPVETVERIKVRNGDIQVFTPAEIGRLLEAARASYPDFLPCLLIGAFAGLRSAEIERLDWSEIHLAEKFIVVTAGKAKTASRRIVPLHANLGAWLAQYATKQGSVWTQGTECFYKRQQQVAAATAVEADEEKGVKAQKAVDWKANALRHSYASYRFAQTGDAGRVAGELGNSAAVIHRHYRELVKPADGERWFKVKPETPTNVLPMTAQITASA